MDDDGVLDVGVVGDVDGYAFVASYGGEGSDEDVGADVDVAHDDGVGVYEGGGVDDGLGDFGREGGVGVAVDVGLVGHGVLILVLFCLGVSLRRVVVGGRFAGW